MCRKFILSSVLLIALPGRPVFGQTAAAIETLGRSKTEGGAITGENALARIAAASARVTAEALAEGRSAEEARLRGEAAGRAIATETQKVSSSFANPWLGAQVGYKFGGTDKFEDNMLVTGRVSHPIDLGNGDDDRFQLPVAANFADLFTDVDGTLTADEKFDQKAKELVSSATGLSAGLYPYYKINPGSVVMFVAHGFGAWKLNGFKDETDANVTNYINQGRFGGGFEVQIGKTGEDGRAMTFSMTPVLTVYNTKEYSKVFGSSKARQGSLEMTLVVPIQRNIGFIVERVTGKDTGGGIRTGLLFTK